MRRPPEIAKGTVFGGDFRVEGLLAQGGMGAVYVVTQLSTGRKRALKCMHPDLVGDPNLRARFALEKKIGASFRSEHIVQVIAASPDDQETPWLAMELLEGEDLHSYLKRKRVLPASEVREIFTQLCHALAEAHRKGIIHRDLKPENIFLTSARRPDAPFTIKVLDFGLAKVMPESLSTSEATVAETLAGLGTPLWMPPEHADMQREVTPAADVWALGLLAFQLLTGWSYWKTAYGHSEWYQAIEVLMHPLVSASARAAEYGCAERIPEGFDAWFARCVVRDARARYQEAEEAGAALDVVLVQAMVRELREGTRTRPPPSGGEGAAVSGKSAGPQADFLSSAPLLLEKRARLGSGAPPWIELETKPSRGELLRRSSGIVAKAMPVSATSTSDELDVRFEGEGEDFRGEDLSRLDLRRANLKGANLAGATLIGTNLDSATLAGANLARADLTEASLRGADLRGADLSGARLVGVELRGVKLDGARLRGAVILGVRGRIEIPSSCDRDGAAILPQGAGSISTNVGLTSGCNSVAFSPDGSLVASGHESGLCVWDAVTGKALRVLTGHSDRVRSVAWSPDGRTLASASDDRTIRLWDLRATDDPSAVRVLSGHLGPVVGIAFAPDGKTLASSSTDETVTLWDIESVAARPLLLESQHSSHVTCLAFSPDGRYLACGSEDNTVTFWVARSGRFKLRLRGHAKGVTCIAWSPDSLSIATASADKTVILWDIESRSVRRVLRSHSSFVASVAFSPDGKILASASGDRTVKLWDVDSVGAPVHKLEHHSSFVTSVAFSPDGRTFASASADKTATLWQVGLWTPLHDLMGHAHEVLCLAWSPDGQALAAGSADMDVALWDASGGVLQRTLQAKAIAGPVQGVAWSPDGQRIAALSGGSVAAVFRVADAAEAPAALAGHMDDISGIAWSPDGLWIASASNDHTVRLWDAASAAPLHVLAGHAAPVRSVAFSPDGRILASGSNDHAVLLWDVIAGQMLRSMKGHEGFVRSVVFSPDRLSLASGSEDGSVVIWHVISGAILGRLRRHSDIVVSIAYSPDGRRLASASFDRSVILWDTAEMAPTHVLEGHTGVVHAVAFSPDGRVVATASEDGTIRLWDAATGACVATLLKLIQGWVAFRPDGRYKLGGDAAGAFWHSIGLCRFEPGEIDPYLTTPLLLPTASPLLL
jgi:WD40 repeat protein/serine/threonine protein kinase